jgi:hypothetical protein
MATKSPTAKQLAARAKFATMAKSGALTRKRKSAARSKKQDIAIAMSEQRADHSKKANEFFERAARAKNPKGRYAGKYPNRIRAVSVGRAGSFARVETNAGETYNLGAGATGGKLPRVGEDIDKYFAAEIPVGEAMELGGNFAVYSGAPSGHSASTWVGTLPTMALAKTFAQALADQTGKSYHVVSE